jgi:hypothetical protein
LSVLGGSKGIRGKNCSGNYGSDRDRMDNSSKILNLPTKLVENRSVMDFRHFCGKHQCRVPEKQGDLDKTPLDKAKSISLLN